MARGREAAKTAWVLLVAASLALGCKRKQDAPDVQDPPDDDTAFAQAGSDAAAAETDAQLITSSLVSSSPGGIGLESADLAGGDLGTREIGAGARAIYFPRGCLQVQNDPGTQTATYTFDHCMGPNGLRSVTGEVKAKYQGTADRLHLELTGTDLSVNGATLDWSSVADVTANGADRTMAWRAQLSGTTAGGRAFTRTNQHTTSWTLGEPCFALEGWSEGQIRAREIRTEISSFRRCRRSCPDAGGTIAITNVTNGKRIELHYDGTNRATFVDPKGNEVTVPLLCAP